MNVGREHSYVYMKVDKNDVNKAVGVLADIVRHARFADEDVEQAKQLVATEQHLLEARPDDIVFDNLHRCCFDSTSHGLGTPLYGNEETLNRITPKHLKDFRSTCVAGKRVVLVGTGGVNTT
uniref:Mitochondrial-processing peptidase subunit beta n=1 Tax=Lygus hesperus TaxID=30085 RepID=A0A0A9Y8U4_LYGHE